MAILMSWFAAACCASPCFQAEPLNLGEARIIKARLVPAPAAITLTAGSDVVLDATLQVTFACENEPQAAAEQTVSTFREWFGIHPDLRTAKPERPLLKSDAYRISASRGKLAIEAFDPGGARNALRTLRQIAEPVRGTPVLKTYFVPEMTIEDAPAMAFRGFHLCWFPENTPVQMERALRLAAYYKMNAIVLEPWGTFVSEKHPELAWPGSGMTMKEIRRLVKVAADLGVTLIPQFNLFGHASNSRIVSGKHVVTDLHPRLQPLFEPLGWTWCLSNPETVRLIEDVVAELHDAFGRPPYFHAGCDEADDMGTCASCRRTDYAGVVRAFLARIHGLLAARKCRMMVWHDMLLRAGDPRWRGYVANGSAQAEALLEALPRDVIVCDWQYGGPKEKETWPTMRHFKGKGFRVLACPWENKEGYQSQSALVRQEGLEGMLCTTWHHLFGSTMMPIFFRAAHSTWGTSPLGGFETLVFSQHLRQVGWDVPVRTYGDTGMYDTQLPEKTSTPR